MSQSRRNPKNEKFQIELSSVSGFLRFIAVLSGTLLILSLLFFAVGEKTEAGNVAYTMCFTVNIAACAGSLLGARFLDRKDRQLEEAQIQGKES